mgnify:CR=1 FL=1
MKLSRSERSWILYDWANSAYSIIITTAVFPLFYETIVSQETYLSTWAFGNSLASAVVAVLAPILGTIADYKGRKRGFFSVFLGLGVTSTLAMVLLSSGQWFVAIAVYVASVIGFSGANVFYDAFLVDVTTNERMDRISSSGFGWGYIGSVIPFVIVILLALNYEGFGLASQAMAYRIGFLLTGLWWGLFSIPILKNVRQQYWIEPSATPIKDSFVRIGRTLKNVRQHKNIFVFLAAYIFYIEGVNTIIRMATPIARSMGIDSTTLIIVLLAIQIVAFPFAILYGALAKRFSGRKMLFVGIGVYVVVTFIAFLLPSFSEGLRTVMFWVLSMLVASSQGGIQALSRSYFGKIVPKEKSAEFFGFYNVVGKFAAIIGPLLVGLFTVLTGEERYGVLSILLLFIVGGLLLTRTKREADLPGTAARTE